MTCMRNGTQRHVYFVPQQATHVVTTNVSRLNHQDAHESLVTPLCFVYVCRRVPYSGVICQCVYPSSVVSACLYLCFSPTTFRRVARPKFYVSHHIPGLPVKRWLFVPCECAWNCLVSFLFESRPSTLHPTNPPGKRF